MNLEEAISHLKELIEKALRGEYKMVNSAE